MSQDRKKPTCLNQDFLHVGQGKVYFILIEIVALPLPIGRAGLRLPSWAREPASLLSFT